MPKYHMSVTLDCPDAEGLEMVEQFQDLIMGWRWVSKWTIGAGLPERTSSTAPKAPRTIPALDPAAVWLEPDYRP